MLLGFVGLDCVDFDVVLCSWAFSVAVSWLFVGLSFRIVSGFYAC